jgi:hypothetical protein
MDGLVAIDELRSGDVLLVAGRSVFSQLVHLIEGSSFDHCLIVAPPDPEHPKFGRDSNDDRTSEIWTYDIGFFGGRHQPLSAYDDIVGAIGVRRHRVSPLNPVVLERAKLITAHTKGYSWDRLLFLSLISATKWSSALTELGPEKSSALVRALYEVLAQMHRSQRFEISGERKICTDLLQEAFDLTTSIGSEYEVYSGLVVPPVPHEGLLWWAAGMSTFEDFLASQPPPKRRGILDEDLAAAPGSEEALQLVHQAATSNGISFPGFMPVDDATLRSIVIDGVGRTLDQLVSQPWRGDVRAASDPRRLAWFLLDTMMRHRTVVTPADIARTDSLVDIGLLDFQAIRWRKHE